MRLVGASPEQKRSAAGLDRQPQSLLGRKRTMERDALGVIPGSTGSGGLVHAWIVTDRAVR
jgi:hypothetical protein